MDTVRVTEEEEKVMLPPAPSDTASDTVTNTSASIHTCCDIITAQDGCNSITATYPRLPQLDGHCVRLPSQEDEDRFQEVAFKPALLGQFPGKFCVPLGFRHSVKRMKRMKIRKRMKRMKKMKRAAR